jgi:hypothetical protein
MNAKEKNEFTWLRPRSSSAALSDGYRFYLNQFKKLFQSSWLAALAYAVVVGSSMSLLINSLPQFIILIGQGLIAIPEVQQQFLVAGIAGCTLLLLYLLTGALLCACGFSLLHKYQASGSIEKPRHWYGSISRHILLRTVKAMLWMVLIALLGYAILMGVVLLSKLYLGAITGLLLTALTIIALVALLLPFICIVCKYILESGSFISHVAHYYPVSMRHWGAVFIVMLVMEIITGLLTLIINLPANILYAANLQSQLGLLQGDPQGMPGYMTWMNLIVFVIAGFILAYVQLSTLFPAYFLYGSIEAQEQERKELNKTES